jgi:hypothetical protein
MSAVVLSNSADSVRMSISVRRPAPTVNLKFLAEILCNLATIDLPFNTKSLGPKSNLNVGVIAVGPDSTVVTLSPFASTVI